MSESLRLAQYQNESLVRLAVAQEYRDLGNRPPRHVYVLPVPGSVLEFHGVLFVQQGFYSRGVFRFRIEFPKECVKGGGCGCACVCPTTKPRSPMLYSSRNSFPNNKRPPLVEFFDEVYHPLVKPRRPYRLQLSERFPKWSRSRAHCLAEVVRFVKRIFFLTNHDTAMPYNADALFL